MEWQKSEVWFLLSFYGIGKLFEKNIRIMSK